MKYEDLNSLMPPGTLPGIARPHHLCTVSHRAGEYSFTCDGFALVRMRTGDLLQGVETSVADFNFPAPCVDPDCAVRHLYDAAGWSLPDQGEAESLDAPFFFRALRTFKEHGAVDAQIHTGTRVWAGGGRFVNVLLSAVIGGALAVLDAPAWSAPVDGNPRARAYSDLFSIRRLLWLNDVEELRIVPHAHGRAWMFSTKRKQMLLMPSAIVTA